MLQQERHSRILDLLSQLGRVYAAELSLQLGVSEDTVRRDLKLLDEQKKLSNVAIDAVFDSKSMSSHLSSLCSWNFNFSRVLLIFRVLAIIFKPDEDTKPKVTFLMFLFALQASRILMRPSSSRLTFLKLSFSIGWSGLAMRASPMKIPVLDFKSVF